MLFRSTDIVSLTTNPSGLGQYQVGEFVYQGYSLNTATATAKVVSFSNNVLNITNINGNFITTAPIIGATTNANYLFTGYTTSSEGTQKDAKISIVPNPLSSNGSNSYTYNTTITEYPNAT